MIPSQMLKGTLEGCILTVIGQGEVYGYEISQKLERYGFGKIAEGTIYPLLLSPRKKWLCVVILPEIRGGTQEKILYSDRARMQ